ncbi:hypothetical protein AA13594_2103 [Gluconacetobacter azotocaptans DSM 13594]|nr:hypothetical protein AA13594_2103 [Gluconacetobacter azotocaptans DSM 13594]
MHRILSPVSWSVAALVALGFHMMPAQGAAPTREDQSAACRGDAIKLCAFAIPNERKVQACMEKKIDKLSPRCRAMFGKDRHKTGKTGR